MNKNFLTTLITLLLALCSLPHLGEVEGAIFHCSPDCAACPNCPYCGQNCTQTKEWWAEYLHCWPAPFDPDTQAFCPGLLWKDILQAAVENRPWYFLAQEWISAMLNVANGSDVECLTCEDCDLCGSENLLTDIQILLATMCALRDNPGPNPELHCLKMLLCDYNNGLSDGCPSLCGGVEDPCPGCDCEECCPFDCSQCSSCPDWCAGCTGGVCPNPCQPCPECPTCPDCPDCQCSSCPDCNCPACPECPRPSGCTSKCKKECRRECTDEQRQARAELKKQRKAESEKKKHKQGSREEWIPPYLK